MKTCGLYAISCLLWLSAAQGSGGETLTKPSPTAERTAQVVFLPAATEADTAPRFQLVEASFAATETVPPDSAINQPTLVRFPTAKPSGDTRNDVVYCEWYPVRRAKCAPAVIVLHSMDGTLPPFRLICRQLADKGIHALLVVMPYCGPRGACRGRRMVSFDVHATAANVVQAVADVRYAAAWVRQQDHVDPCKTGLLGISLGGMVGALAVCHEPRFESAVLVLSGGDIGDVVWASPHLSSVRNSWLTAGGTRESFLNLAAEIDPAKHAHRFPGRVLMINAAHDEIIPRRSAEALWNAFGRPEIVWWPAGHAGSVTYALDGLRRAREFFTARHGKE